MSDNFVSNAVSALSNAENRYNNAVQNGMNGAEVGGLSPQIAGTFKTLVLANTGMTRAAGMGRVNHAALRIREVMSVVVLVDGSGSMYTNRQEVVTGINEMVRDLSDPRNPQRDNIEFTVWIFSDNSVRLLSVDNPAFDSSMPESDSNLRRLEIANMPVGSIPPVKILDYECSGQTPLNKAIIMASGAASIRAEGLRMNKTNRVASKHLVVVMTDGMNNLWSEWVGSGQKMSYDDVVVQNIVKNLLASESWMFALGAAGQSMDAKQIASNLGFPLFCDVDNVGGWRKFLGIASKSALAVSQAAAGPIGSTNLTNNGFLSALP